MQNLVVVRASVSGNNIRQDCHEEKYEFAEGDIGVLTWEWHKEDMQYVRALVIWDKDTSKQPRRIHIGAVVPVGVQQGDCRVYMNHVQGAQ